MDPYYLSTCQRVVRKFLTVETELNDSPIDLNPQPRSILLLPSLLPPPNLPPLGFHLATPRSFRISSSMVEGGSLGSNLLTTTPSLSTRNLVKFQRMAPPFFVRNFQSGCARPPLTRIFENMSKVTPYLEVTCALISASVPGSWLLN